MTDNIEVLEALDSLRCDFRDRTPEPVSGLNCTGLRVEAATPVEGLPHALIPRSMTADPEYADALSDSRKWRRLRCRHDFEFWAFSCVTIKYKNTWQDRPFILNGPQQRLLAILEKDRLDNAPLRLILLKARQWGGSLIYIYSYI